MNSARAQWHDYRECRIYQLTISVINRDAYPFGTLTGNDEASAAVALTALGKVLNDEICGMERRHPQIVLMEHVVMPDHCHILLEVKQPLPEHLGKVVWGIKYGVTAAYLNALAAQYGKPCKIEGSRPSLSERQKRASQVDTVGSASGDVLYVPPLWAPGYHDRIVSKRGQLALLKRYIRRNPARLWAKRHSDHWHMQLSDEFLELSVAEAQRLKVFAAYCDLHRGKRAQSALRHSSTGHYADTHIDLLAKTLVTRKADADATPTLPDGRIVGLRVRTCGNNSLIDGARPLVRVRLSRSITKEQFEVEVERLLTLCEQEGAVLISPFISWSEKMVLRLARGNHYPHIIVEPTAMSQYYKLSDATRSIAKQLLPSWWPTSKYGRLLSAIQERSDMQCGTGGEILVIAPWHNRPESDINGKAEMELMNEICAVLAEHQA